jgi:hypothetical protein
VLRGFVDPLEAREMVGGGGGESGREGTSLQTGSLGGAIRVVRTSNTRARPKAP